MKTFRFQAVRPADGGTVSGRLDAATHGDALLVIERRGLLAVVVEAAPEASFRRHPSIRDQATVFRSLASLVDAGVPLAQALRATRRIAGRAGDTIDRVEARVREGASLAAALQGEPEWFSPVTIGLVLASEGGSGMAAGLSAAADELERRAESIARIRAALAYPAILFLVGLTSILGILLFVVPRFAVLLADVDAGLPPLTRLLILTSALLQQHALPTACALLATGWGLWRLAARHRPRLHTLLHGVPIIGPIRLGLATSRAARTLASLLATGVPALRALHVTQRSVGDEVVAARIGRTAARVAEGASLSHALEAEAAFTSLTLQMAAIGDGAGRLPELLGRAATIESEIAEHRVRRLVTILEPALIIVFASLVALVAAALLQAVYSLRPGGA